MPLGGIILYLAQNLSASAPVQSVRTLIPSGMDYSVEARVCFPLAGNGSLPPTELSGALWTISDGSTPTSLWYEKSAATDTTGNVYVTSSFGRVQLTSAPIFNNSFHSISFVWEHATGSMTLYTTRYDGDEQVFASSSLRSGSFTHSDINRIDLGSSPFVLSRGQFWMQEFRLWKSPLTQDEIFSHAQHFESYGRATSYSNSDLLIHWRMNDGAPANQNGNIWVVDSTKNSFVGTGSFSANAQPYAKFLEPYAYIPSLDYGWNQEKIRIFDGSRIDPADAFIDEKSVSLEFNMYDALNEDISHVMTSYDEMTNVLGMPMNRYREDYEGLQQMRETYFKRLQGSLNFRVFADMLDFFDSSFSSIVERLLPARTSFKGDEMIVESHMLERPKYQYQLRPIIEGRIEISGSISVIDRESDFE